MKRYIILFSAYLLFSILYAIVEGLSLSVLPLILRALLGTQSELSLIPALKPFEGLIEGMLKGDKFLTLRSISILVGGIFTLKMFVGAAKKMSILAVMEMAAKDLREKVFRSVMFADMSHIKRLRSGDLVSRLTGEINYIKLAIRDGVGNLLGETLNLLVFATLALTSAPVLSVFAWSILILASILGWAVSRAVKRRSKKALETLGDFSAYLSKSLEGIKSIKSLNAVGKAVERFADFSQRLYVQFLKLEFTAALAPILSETLVGLSAALILFLAGYFIFKTGTVSPDAFIVFLAASLSMIRPLKLVFQSLAYINTARTSYERLKAFMDLPEERWGELDPTGWKELELKDIVVRQDGREVLRVPHLRIRRGDRLAVIGRSGAGKSTLIDLIAGFLKPSEGEILLDGIPLYSYSVEKWREVVGYVPQEVYVFDGSLRENLGGADGKLLQDIQLTHLMDRLDEDTVNLKDTLSGGEKQRIGIARVLARKPSLLLMDEPTSALDTKSENALGGILRGLKDITLVVVAHKRSTALWCEKVVVIERGRVVCVGTHTHLRKTCPHYSELMDVKT